MRGDVLCHPTSAEMSCPTLLQEKYLIQCAKTETSQPNVFMWGYLVSGNVFAGFGAWYGNIHMLTTAFIMVCGIRIHEESSSRKWAGFGEIIRKFESAENNPETQRSGFRFCTMHVNHTSDKIRSQRIPIISQATLCS